MKNQKTPIFIFALLLLLLVAHMSTAVAMVGLYIPLDHLDGAFQTASSLFRLNNGEIIGRDFLPYLGIIVSYINYPTFILFGHNLSASAMASLLMVKILALSTIYIFLYLTFRERSSQLWLGIIAIVVYFVLDDSVIFSPLFEIGGSLRPVRRFAPIAAVILLIPFYKLVNTNTQTKLTVIYLSIVASIVLLWSNDFALISALCLVVFIFLPMQHHVQSCMRMGLFLALALVGYISLLMVVTHGNAWTWLQYCFVDVLGDQWWYFAHSSKKIFTPSDLIHRFISFPPLYISTILCIAHLFVGLKRRSFMMLSIGYIGLCFIAAGLLSEVGGHVLDSYYFQLYYYMPFAFVSLLFMWCNQYWDTLSKYFYIYKTILLIIGSIYIFRAGIYSSLVSYAKAEDFAKQHFSYVPELGGYMYADKNNKELIDFWHHNIENQNILVAEEYWGLLSALSNNKYILPSNSVIHALGKRSRVAWLSRLNELRPQYITTSNPEYTHWQAWSVGQNWWFYKHVITYYYPYITHDTVIVWKRRPTQLKMIHGVVSCKFDQNNNSLNIKNYTNKPSNKYYLYEIGFLYTPVGSRGIINIDNEISERFACISIDPTNDKAYFPTLLTRSSYTINLKNKKNDKVFAAGPCSVVCYPIDKETWEALFVQKSWQNRFPDSAHKLTDENWLNGISRFTSKFLVLNNRHNRERYAEGNNIKFHDGQIRTVIKLKTQKNRFYLHVHFSGPLLNGDEIGHPLEIQVIPD